MKTRYIFILSFLIIILTSSYVSSIDNDSNLIKEVNFNKINLDNNQSDLNVSDKENYSSNASLTNGSSSDSSSATDNAYKEPTKRQCCIYAGIVLFCTLKIILLKNPL